MNEFLQQLVSGIAVGCVYALVALGFVLIYKATDIVNFAHGEVMMVGAFLGLTFIEILKMPYWIGLLMAIACMTVFGMLLNRFLLRPLAGQGILAVIVVTLGLSILLRAFASVIWGPETFALQTPFYNRVVRVGEVVLSQEHVAIIVLTIVLVAALYAFFRYSRIGIAMQATSENQLAAYYVGIPAFVQVNMGYVGLKAFPAAVLGGFGSIPGAIVGGVIIGVVESMAVLYLPEGINNVAAYILLLLVLMVRPQGLFGIQSKRRV